MENNRDLIRVKVYFYSIIGYLIGSIGNRILSRSFIRSLFQWAYRKCFIFRMFLKIIRFRVGYRPIKQLIFHKILILKAIASNKVSFKANFFKLTILNSLIYYLNILNRVLNWSCIRVWKVINLEFENFKYLISF